MIKGIFILFNILIVSVNIIAQQNITIADVDKLKNMAPAQLETEKSTLLIGPATKAEFLGIKIEMKNQLYITFDGNKQFADFGLKNLNVIGLSGTPLPIGPQIKIGGNLAGIEVSNSISINGGYNKSVEKKGLLAL